MIEYDPDKRIYVDPTTGNHAKFKHVEPRESWIEVDFVWSTERYRFFATVPWATQGPLTFQVLGSSYFEPKRSIWIGLGDLPDVIEGLRPFVAAWSSQAWQDRIVAFQDNRADKGRTLEEALAPPRQEALKALISEFKQRRR